MCGIGGIISLYPLYLGYVMSIPFSQIYRGRDGCGISWTNSENIFILKDAVSPAHFYKKYNNVLYTIKSRMMIVHHRLPSVGGIKYENTHPFFCPMSNVEFSLIHNGTCPQIMKYRNKLIEKGHIIQGDTDSEIICHIIGECINNGMTFYKILKEINAGVVVVLTKDSVYIKSSTYDIPIGISSWGFVFASTRKAVIKTMKKLKWKVKRIVMTKFARITKNGILTDYITRTFIRL